MAELRPSDTPSINTVPGWTVFRDTQQRIASLEARLDKADGALRTLGLSACDTCGEWSRRAPAIHDGHVIHYGHVGPLHTLHPWNLICERCLLGKLADMADDDVPDWDAFSDPGTGAACTEALAAIAARYNDVYRAVIRAWDAIEEAPAMKSLVDRYRP